ncbi:MAG TPA: BTAD domain-containing putative transcriptional regulator [Anaerolineae bacterium]|nr:BTAD domain-containing putative transcriptional regulator [Anaerolineae bacterium]
MATNLSVVFSLLTLPLLAGMIMFVLIRRPRDLTTWTFVGVMAGLIVFYMANVILYWPDISVQAGLIWQVISIQGANLTVLSALLLNFLLRNRRLARWEWALVAFIVVRMAIDTIWLVSLLQPLVPHPCLDSRGLPRVACPPEDRLAVVTGAIAAAGVAVLFISTAFKAAAPRRLILRRYIIWIVLLVVMGSLGLHALTLLGQDAGVLPGQPLTMLAALLGLRLFLALEEEETGARFPELGWRVFAWLVILIIALTLDLAWDWLGAPVWTLIVLAAGVAGGIAYVINLLERRAVGASNADIAGTPAWAALPLDTAGPSFTAPSAPLCIYLLGPMRITRNGEALPNTSDVWRSSKTRSLLAYLALRREAGATQVEIIDALWPVDAELDAKAERSSLSALRSYLSTLRRVLDPTGPRGSDRFVVHEGERYGLRPDEVWVDVWQFEALANQAEALLAQDRWQEGLACWQGAIALYAPEGLLPDESYLPAPLIEPARESLRQRWLAGLRSLARAEQAQASAPDLWETIHQAEPLDQEATIWLIEHYRRLGNANGLRMVLQRRRDAEAEMDML